MDTSAPSSPSVDRLLTILETLSAAAEPLTLTALSQATGISLTTCAAIMTGLEERGYATRKIVGRSHFWRLTMRLYGLASQILSDTDLSTVAIDEMRAVADELGFPVHIGVLNGGSVVYVAKAQASGFIQFDTFPGKVTPFNLTALGKAIVAHLPDDQVRPLLRDLPQGQGPNSVDGGTPTGLLAQLETVRKVGYATEFEEDQAGVSCLAVPFFGVEGTVVGAVGITALAADLESTFDSSARELMRLGALISERLGYRAPAAAVRAV